MRAALLSVILTCSISFVSPATAQSSGLELQAGLGYKAALHRYAAATYDYFIKSLRQAKPEQLQRQVAMYGQPPQPASRLASLSFEHSVWTLGQLVPYLRLNGVTPPEYKMPF